MCVEEGGGGKFAIVENWPFVRVGPTGMTESFYDDDSDCSN